MTCRRQIEPLKRLQGDALDRAMAGVGMAFAVTPQPYPAANIEPPRSAGTMPSIDDILFFASQLGIDVEPPRSAGPMPPMEERDFRVLNRNRPAVDVWTVS